MPARSRSVPRRSTVGAGAMAGVAVAIVCAAGAARAQPVTERTPNMGGAWIVSPDALHFQFSHRFQIVGEDADVADLFGDGTLVNYPTFDVVWGAAPGLNAGFRYSSQSLVAGQANEWQPYVRWAPLGPGGNGISAALTGAWNGGTQSVDGEAAVRAEIGSLFVLGAVRGFTDVFDLPAGESDEAVALAAGVGLRLNRHVTLAADAADLVAGVHTPAAWSAGVQLGIPSTPHTLSILATNVTSGTLEGTVTGVTNTVFWGFEFTIPLGGAARWGEILDPEAQGRAAEAAAAPGAPEAPVVEVEMRDFGFRPAEVSVRPGTVIRWVNRDPVDHTVTPDAGVWGSTLLGPGESFEITVREPGMFAYHCEPHPSMQGIVRVRAGRGR